MKLLVVKTLNGYLKPAYDSDLEVFKKIPTNKVVQIDYVKKRNIRFHRKFFALINLAFENQEAYSDSETMRKDIIKHAGYYNEHVNAITSEITQEAKSISFDSMDELEFSELYEKTKNVICNWLGIDNDSINEEVEKYY